MRQDFAQMQNEKDMQELAEVGLDQFFKPKLYTNPRKHYQRMPRQKVEDDLLFRHAIQQEKLQ